MYDILDMYLKVEILIKDIGKIQIIIYVEQYLEFNGEGKFIIKRKSYFKICGIV